MRRLKIVYNFLLAVPLYWNAYLTELSNHDLLVLSEKRFQPYSHFSHFSSCSFPMVFTYFSRRALLAGGALVPYHHSQDAMIPRGLITLSHYHEKLKFSQNRQRQRLDDRRCSLDFRISLIILSQLIPLISCRSEVCWDKFDMNYRNQCMNGEFWHLKKSDVYNFLYLII